ncbi:MAG: SH3 domain-containing protein [Clostridia bacterium]|nr:SH3 domain-containing protein [Clostridia bacterium]
MKKLISIVTVILMVLGLMIPVFSSAEAVTAPAPAATYKWVNCENGKTLNVREVPSTKAKVLCHVECGKRLEVIEQVGVPAGWIKVKVNDKIQGYVMTKFLWNTKPGKYEITEREDNFKAVNPYIVTAKALNQNTEKSVGLRVKPNKTSNMIRRLQAGDQLKVIAAGKVWSQVVDMLTGRTGYVANDYIE